jgi:hypothetical protein
MGECMSSVAVTAENGIVIRRRALAERNVSYRALLTVFEIDQPFGVNEKLVTFGPSFGQEALEALTQKLIALGLIYFDDFFEFVGVFPRWCKFSVAFVPHKSD